MRTALFLCLCLTAFAPAAEKKPTGKITAYIADPKDEKIAKVPVMVSILLDGKVAAQSEINMDSLQIFNDLPVGIYEVRAEGAGLGSIVKRGVAVTAKGDTEVRFLMKAGKGATVIEYSTWKGGRDDLLDLMKRVEKALERLEKK